MKNTDLLTLIHNKERTNIPMDFFHKYWQSINFATKNFVTKEAY